MPPRDITVAAQVLKYMAAPVDRPFTHDLATTLHPGPQHHDLFMLVRQMGIIDQCFEQIMVVNNRF